jgi:F0F1-type ATP synthase assembly protein I
VALDQTTVRRSPFYPVIIAQSIATMVLSVLALIAGRLDFCPVDVSETAALSVAAAGAVCVIPGLYLLVTSTRQIAKGTTGLGLALKGEAGRFALSAIGFVVVFVQFRDLNALVFFGVFIALQAFNVIVPLLKAIKRRNRYQ